MAINGLKTLSEALFRLELHGKYKSQALANLLAEKMYIWEEFARGRYLIYLKLPSTSHLQITNTHTTDLHCKSRVEHLA